MNQKLSGILSCALAFGLAAGSLGCLPWQSTKTKEAVTATPTEKGKSRYFGPKRRIGVVEFENKSAYGQGRLGGGATDILIGELTKTGRFIVVEREKLSKVLEEQRLGAGGMIDEATVAKTGKILGLGAIVTGSVSNFGVNTVGSDFILFQRKRQVASVTVDIRAVDTETAQVLLADQGKGEATTSHLQILGLGTRGGYNEILEGEALRAAIVKLVENFVSQVGKRLWSCRIAKVQDGTVYLDAGSESGLEIGQKLVAYHLGEEVKSPTTGLVIGRTEEKIAELEIEGFFGEDGSRAVIKSGKAPSDGDVARLP